MRILESGTVVHDIVLVGGSEYAISDMGINQRARELGEGDVVIQSMDQHGITFSVGGSTFTHVGHYVVHH